MVSVKMRRVVAVADPMSTEVINMGKHVGQVCFRHRGYDIIAEIGEYQDGLYLQEYVIDSDILTDHELDLLYGNVVLHNEIDTKALELFVEQQAEIQARKQEG